MDNTSQNSRRGDWFSACVVILFRQHGSKTAAQLQTSKDIATHAIQVTQQKCYLLVHIQPKTISSGSCNEIDGSGSSPDLFKYPPPSKTLSIITANSIPELLNNVMLWFRENYVIFWWANVGLTNTHHLVQICVLFP
jgi:hypothetical protein